MLLTKSSKEILPFQPDVKGNTFNILHGHLQKGRSQVLLCTVLQWSVLCPLQWQLPAEVPGDWHRSCGCSGPGPSRESSGNWKGHRPGCMASLLPLHVTAASPLPIILLLFCSGTALTVALFLSKVHLLRGQGPRTSFDKHLQYWKALDSSSPETRQLVGNRLSTTPWLLLCESNSIHGKAPIPLVPVGASIR